VGCGPPPGCYFRRSTSTTRCSRCCWPEPGGRPGMRITPNISGLMCSVAAGERGVVAGMRWTFQTLAPRCPSAMTAPVVLRFRPARVPARCRRRRPEQDPHLLRDVPVLRGPLCART
jgi:hypothetical protein